MIMKVCVLYPYHYHRMLYIYMCLHISHTHIFKQVFIWISFLLRTNPMIIHNTYINFISLLLSLSLSLSILSSHVLAVCNNTNWFAGLWIIYVYIYRNILWWNPNPIPPTSSLDSTQIKPKKKPHPQHISIYENKLRESGVAILESNRQK